MTFNNGPLIWKLLNNMANIMNMWLLYVSDAVFIIVTELSGIMWIIISFNARRKRFYFLATAKINRFNEFSNS